MRGPRDGRLRPEPWDPAPWAPPKFLRQHAARNARRRRVRRAVVWLVTAGVAFGFLFADGGLVSILRQRVSIRRLERDVHRLEAQHRALAREIELRRNDPATIERLAREEYGMIRSGERVIRIIEVDEAEAQRMEAAQTATTSNRGPFGTPAVAESVAVGFSAPHASRSSTPR